MDEAGGGSQRGLTGKRQEDYRLALLEPFREEGPGAVEVGGLAVELPVRIEQREEALKVLKGRLNNGHRFLPWQPG